MPSRKLFAFGIVLSWAALITALAVGCAQFGVPEPPPSLQGRGPFRGEVFVVYHPYTVLGFGHTGVILISETPGRFLRFDQFSSAEIDYLRKEARGQDGFFEPVSARLPSIFGFTREYVTRREGPDPWSLLDRGEILIPIPGVAPGPARRAAEIRFARSRRLEQAEADRYSWLFNNCHHFVRDILRMGGPIHERYFPKHFAEAYLAELSPPIPQEESNDPAK